LAAGIATLAVLLGSPARAQVPVPNTLQWVPSLERAMSQAFIHNKPVLVYVMSDFCAFCNLMETSTLRDSLLIDQYNRQFIPVRLNATDTLPQWFMGTRYTYSTERRTHDLAYLLLDGRTQYPTWVVLNRLGEVVAQVPGFLDRAQLQRLFAFYSTSAYMTTSWEEFESTTHY
jgi:thioredoxin-related protein